MGEQEKYVAVTQFEETHARQVFPCFDHPAKKATFDIEYILDEHLTGIANTPVLEETELEDGRKLVKFETTPIMASYLLFFGIGEFEFLKDSSKRVLQRVATTPGKTQYGQFGLEYSIKALQFGEDYTGGKYSLTNSLIELDTRFLSAVIFLLLSEVETFPILVFVMAIYGVSHGIRAVVEWTFLATSTPSTLRAPVSAYAETMINMGDFLGAITAGVLTLVFPIPSIFKLGALVLLPAIIAPILIQKAS